MKVNKKSTEKNSNSIRVYQETLKNKSNKSYLNCEDFDDINEDHVLNHRNGNNLVKQEQEVLNDVDQFEIMDDVNFQFGHYNKIDLDSNFDIINEDDSHVKGTLFDGAADLVSNSNVDLDESNDDTCVVPNKRSLKRKQQLSMSKLQLSVRTTPRHYSKMFEFFEANPGMATGQLQKLSYRRKWRELTEILNSEGLGEKSTEKWQKTWSDYKLHLRKKISSLKRSGINTELANLFTEQEERALGIVGLSLKEESVVQAIQKRFNPSPENEDSSSHSTVQSTTQNPSQNTPTSTQEIAKPTSTTSVIRQFTNKYVRQQLKYKRLLRRRKFQNYQAKTIKELRLLRTTLNSGLGRIGDILEKLVNKNNDDSHDAQQIAQETNHISKSTLKIAEMVNNLRDIQ